MLKIFDLITEFSFDTLIFVGGGKIIVPTVENGEELRIRVF